jgi:cytochrome c oxidase cbb3-type subunit 4
MDIAQIQGYAYFFFTAFLVVILYAYIFYLYRTQKTGERDWEKYGDMALNDDITDKPVEQKRSDDESK